MTRKLRAGVPLPLGAHLRGAGINFAIFSRHATGVSLVLFGSEQAQNPRHTLALDRKGSLKHHEAHIFYSGAQ